MFKKIPFIPWGASPINYFYFLGTNQCRKNQQIINLNCQTMKFLGITKLVFGILFLTLISSCKNNSQNEAGNLNQQVLQTMSQATDYMRSISVGGGYLWRYSTDFTEFAGEHEATATQVWVQFPGTPAMGNTFLRAYDLTKDTSYLSAAEDVAMALVNGQLQSGGWDYRIEFNPDKRKEYYYHVEEDKYPDLDLATRKNVSTYDDDNTQEALRFLMSFLERKDSEDSKTTQIRAALDYGLDKLVEAQYPIGAWPQRWNGKAHDPAKFPVKAASLTSDYPREQPDGSYYGHYTFNDNSHDDILKTLILASKFTGNEKYLDAVKRGADYLILAQLPEPQPVWAQQYDADMHPAWARAFEPPSVTAGESVGVIRMLVDMYLELGDEKYLEPIPPAIDWYNRSRLENGKWARMYELNTNRPIYGDRDKKIHYTLAEISKERRTGYGWQGDFGVENVIEYYNEVKNAGRDQWLENHVVFKDDVNRNHRIPDDLEAAVKKAIESLDDQNRWVAKIPPRRFNSDKEEWITSFVYIRNMNLLCDYLEANSKATD